MIQIHNLSVHYQHNLALNNISLQIADAALMAIVGPNGAGKSTLLKSIMQQLNPTSGSINLGQFSLKNIAYLPQSSQIDRKFPITVREFVSAGSWQRTSFWRGFNRKEQALLTRALTKVNLAEMAQRQISELSGGQFQRLLFARMLLQDANILLLDEPFGAIDSQTIEELMQLLKECQQQGKTVITVIHDLTLVQRYFPQTALVATQLIAAGQTADVLTPENLIKAGYPHFAHCAIHHTSGLQNSAAKKPTLSANITETNAS